MGVPAFFRHLIKKYNVLINGQLKQKINALYIDANCLFHPQCFKILDMYPDLKNQDELFEKMAKEITDYIDLLIDYVKPTDLIYIAVDGVAPLAKMSQQRKRRFGSTNNYKHVVYKKYGIKYNDSWSNIVISPATEFMNKLHLVIQKYYEKNKKVMYDSYLNKGEGEHKIFQYMKNTDNHNFCNIIYGLDADLIFLSLACGIPNVYLLREQSQITNNENEDNDFCYVDIDITKKSINKEFTSYIDTNKELPTFINDYIFICYFLGNDFLPHLPSIDINTGGLNTIFNIHIDCFVKHSNLITFENNLVINNDFLKEFIKMLSLLEDNYFKNILPDYLNKQKRRTCLETEDYKREIWEIENLKNVKINDPIKLGIGKSEDWKYRYYSHYFGTNEYMKEHVDKMCHNYIEGLLWVARYYFEKCPTWKWQYRYSHAPFLSDIYEYIKDKNIMKDFNLPYEDSTDMYSQLVGIIPPEYSNILPKKLQKLCVSIDSGIADMYPIKYELDMINKTQLYKCIPIIPTLDLKRIENVVSKIIKD